jgi:hypothetical protein
VHGGWPVTKRITSPSADASLSPEDGGLEAVVRQDLSRRALFRRDAVITFPVFWDCFVANASEFILELEGRHLRMSKRSLQRELLADEQDDKAHFTPENLPEFLYEHHLEA